MADDIDIGIGVHTNPSDITNAERAGDAVREFTLTAQQGAAILQRVGNDFDKFRKEVARMKEEFEKPIKPLTIPPVPAVPTPGGSGGAPNQPSPEQNEAAIRRIISLQQQATAEDDRRSAAVRRMALIQEQAIQEDNRRTVSLQTNTAATTQAAQKTQLFANAADASFTKIPPSARTAANAISLISSAAISGTGSMAGLANAAGSVAFGISNLAGSARLAASAAGIGAVVTILTVVVEALHRGTEAAREQAAALKELGQTPEFLSDASRAVAQLVERLGQLKGFKPEDFTLLGGTAEQQKALENFNKSVAALQTRDKIAQLTQFGGAIADLKTRLTTDKISIDQYREAIVELSEQASKAGTTFPGIGQLIQEATVAGEKFNAARSRLRKANAGAVAEQADADRDLGRNLADARAELAALRSGGPSAAKRIQDEQRALELATKAWDTFAQSEKGGEVAGTRFADALKLTGTTIQQQAQQRLQDARAYVAARRAIDEGLRPISDRVPEEQARIAIDLAKRTADAEIAERKIVSDADQRQEKAKLAARAITQTQFNQEQLQREVRFADDVLKIRSREFDKQQAALQQLETELAQRKPTPERDAALIKVRADLQALGLERRKAIAEADDEVAKAEGDAVEKTAQIAKAITDATLSAQIEILRNTGHVAEAAALESGRRFKDAIAEIERTAGKASPAITVQVRREEVERARIAVQALETDVTQATDHLQAKLAEINVRVAAHAITESQARREIVQAEIDARDVIAKSIPLLERQAAILGDTHSADQVLALKTRLIELNLAIRQQSDAFFKLKETARESATDALAGLFEGATKFGTQDKTEINALNAQLVSARQELEGLLSTPSGRRTGEENRRITELRGEIEQTSVSLERAKQSITTWRDLFLNAAQSVVDALIKVSSQMLATSLIEKLLHFGGGDDSIIDEIISRGLPGVRTVNRAAGGLIRGPGTATSDSIPARLSNREFVQPAAATDYYGVDTMEALRRRIPSREMIRAITLNAGLQLNLRPRMSAMRFAEGGLVTASDVGARGETGTQKFLHQFEFIGMPEGTTIRHVDSPQGHRTIVKIITDNANAVNAGLGR